MAEGVDTGNVSTIDWQVVEDVRALAAVTSRPSVSVPRESIEAFHRDGVVLIRGAFLDWVDPLADGLERVLASPNAYAFPCESTDPGEAGRFFDCYCNWQRVPEWLAFVLTSGAASLAAQLMGSTSAQFFHEHAFAKEPGTTKATPWHHDLPYYCVDGAQTASVYVALDPIPIDTSVRFLRGSHRDGELYRPRTFRSGAEYETGDDQMISVPAIGPEDPSIFVAALEPGDALVFDFRTLHGTTSAENKIRRRAFSTRWLGDDVRYVERPGVTSPPLGDLGVPTGDRMPEHLFPVLWP